MVLAWLKLWLLVSTSWQCFRCKASSFQTPAPCAVPSPLQAGARKVYAVEASAMAKFARQLADSNPDLGTRIQLVNGKVEEVQVPEKASMGARGTHAALLLGGAVTIALCLVLSRWTC